MSSSVFSISPPKFEVSISDSSQGFLVVMKYEFCFDNYSFPFFLGYLVSEIVFVRFFKATVTEKVIVVFDEGHFAFAVFFCAG